MKTKNEISQEAAQIASDVRETYDSMSNTDKKSVQTVVLRVRRKTLAAQMRELKGKKEATNV